MSNFGELVEGIQANGNAAQAHDDGAWFRKVFLPTIGRYVEAQVKPLRQRIEQLERRTADFKYVGVYESSNAYREGNFCTYQGSLWHCQSDTSVTPGTDASWVLCCKRGKDAR